jgi:hypothetical protein
MIDAVSITAPGDLWPDTRTALDRTCPRSRPRARTSEPSRGRSNRASRASPTRLTRASRPPPGRGVGSGSGTANREPGSCGPGVAGRVGVVAPDPAGRVGWSLRIWRFCGEGGGWLGRWVWRSCGEGGAGSGGSSDSRRDELRSRRGGASGGWWVGPALARVGLARTAGWTVRRGVVGCRDRAGWSSEVERRRVRFPLGCGVAVRRSARFRCGGWCPGCRGDRAVARVWGRWVAAGRSRAVAAVVCEGFPGERPRARVRRSGRFR